MSYVEIFAHSSESPESAFERLLIKYQPMILAATSRFYLNYNLSRETDREDLIQIGKTALWEAANFFDMEHVRPGRNPNHVFEAFAKKTIHGKLSDYLRKWYKQSSEELLSTTDEPLDLPAPSAVSIDQQMRELLEDWIHLLSPRERDYLTLALFQGMKTKHIADIHHVSENTVRSWKKSLVRKLLPLKERLSGK